jgi:tRNA G10  N-methylase Trm11
LNVSFENGELILENSGDAAKLILTQIEDQLYSDFLIEAIIKIEESDEENFSGLIWGASGINAFYVNAYNLKCESRMYNTDEMYNYCHFVEENSTKIDPSGYNKISIRKQNNKYHFFVNEKFIYITDIHELYGNQFGFYLGGNCKIHVNRLSIKSE